MIILWPFIPFIAVLGCVVLTQKVILALTLGIFSILFVKNIFLSLSLYEGLTEIIKTFCRVISTRDYGYPFLFFIILILIIEMLRISGAIDYYRQWICRYLKSPSDVEKTTLWISPFFFIDDYLSTLSIGALIRPISDCYGIARVKFAYLLDSVSSPLCVLIPFGSWSIMLTSQFKTLFSSEKLSSYLSLCGIHTASSFLFSLIPFLLYPLCIFCLAWYIVYMKISYGPMKTFEEQAKKEIPSLQSLTTETCTSRPLFFQLLFFLPFAVFACVLVAHFLSTLSFNPSVNFIELLDMVDLEKAMLRSILLALLSLIGACAHFRILTWQFIKETCFSTYVNGSDSLILLIMAATFGLLLKSIGTPAALAVLLKSLSFDTRWYPLMFFIASGTLCVAIGSVWGVISLLTPLLLSLPENIFILQLSAASLISGSIAGSHFTPLSNAMLIASASAHCSVMEHFKTHIPYALPALLSCLISLFLISFIPNQLYQFTPLFTIPLFSLFLTFIFMRIIKKTYKKIYFKNISK